MSKTIYLTESQLSALKLKPFIYKAIMGKHTSLGDNPALPPSGDFGFIYDLTKKRFEEVSNRLNNLIDNGLLENSEPDYLVTELNKRINRCIELEKPLKNQLENLCVRILNEQFSIPEEVVLLSCSLVQNIKSKHAMRIMPEDNSNNGDGYSFEDVDEMDLSNKFVLKRRTINALIQGASVIYSVKSMLRDYTEDIDKLSTELIPLWKQILIISDYLLFVKEEKITDKNPMQNSYVEVHVGKGGKKTSIASQGIVFPFLLKETFKGFFELFSSHGLPMDDEKAMYIIRKADFLVAEPWDIRLGVPMWEIIYKQLKGTELMKLNTIPYFFTDICTLELDEFNNVLKNLLASTKAGKRFVDEESDDIIHDIEYQQFSDRIQNKNNDSGLLTDGYFTSDELDNVNVENDEEVLTEDDNSGYETYYRGICGEFDELKVKRQIWLADVPEYAAMYAEECEDGHLYEFTVDMTRYRDFDWYNEMPDWWEPIDGVSEDVQKELMKYGYNGYTFPLDESDVLVLFDKSLIVNVKEIPLTDYLEESKKIRKPILIDENMENEMQGYHGSSADFDKFWHKKYMSTGAGSQAFGWGTYISDDYKIAEGYLEREHNQEFYNYDELIAEIANSFGWDDMDAATEIISSMPRYSRNGLIDFENYVLSERATNYGGFDDFDEEEETRKRHELSKKIIDYLSKISDEEYGKARWRVLKLTSVYRGYMYEVDIPDNNGQNYIEWYEHFPPEFMERVIRCLMRIPNNKLNAMAANNYPFRCDLYKDIQWMKENPDRADKMIEILCNDDEYEEFFSRSYYSYKVESNGGNVYRRLQSLMGSDKAASLFLMQCGFDGITYMAGTKWQKPEGAADDARNYVIFDANKVKILDKKMI